jgi:hypothetical protein
MTQLSRKKATLTKQVGRTEPRACVAHPAGLLTFFFVRLGRKDESTTQSGGILAEAWIKNNTASADHYIVLLAEIHEFASVLAVH